MDGAEAEPLGGTRHEAGASRQLARTCPQALRSGLIALRSPEPVGNAGGNTEKALVPGEAEQVY